MRDLYTTVRIEANADEFAPERLAPCGSAGKERARLNPQSAFR